jgi:methylated-DNA-[protein]-cysteine S-methyltransferase
MSGRAYTIFDTAIGRCGIAWSAAGVVGVQLPQAREIETRRRPFQLYPDAREMRPPPDVREAIEGIAALVRGKPCDFSDVTLDMSAIPNFDRRVYQATRGIPRGKTVTCEEIAVRLKASGAVRSLAQAIAKNPFMIVVPCHRVLESGDYAGRISRHGGIISRRLLLSIEGTPCPSSKTLFDALLPVAPPRLSG